MYIGLFTQLLVILVLVVTPSDTPEVYYSKVITFVLLFLIDIFELIPVLSDWDWKQASNGYSMKIRTRY